jgi:sugar diacid utilization regulator
VPDDVEAPHDSAGEPVALPTWAIGAVAGHDLQSLRERVIDRCASEVFADKTSDERFMSALGDSITENVRALRDVLAARVPPADTELSQRLRFAAVEAESWVPHATLERSYRLSFSLQWQEWCEVLIAAATSENVANLDALEALKALGTLVHTYTDSVMSNVAGNFARSEQALNRSRAHVRQRLVRDLLVGSNDVLSPADLVTLDYSLKGSHLAVLLPGTPQEAAAQLVSRLRAAVHPQHTLIYPVRLDSSLLWLGADSAWPPARVVRVVSTLQAGNVTASVSDAISGLDGFLQTYQQVNKVEEIRRSARELRLPKVVQHSDVRLEILVLQSPDLARDFVQQELGPLARATQDSAKLRTTLEASFRFGSHVAAAESLHLHEHTVRNRLQKAGELLGPYVERRTELQVALRLYKVLDDA